MRSARSLIVTGCASVSARCVPEWHSTSRFDTRKVAVRAVHPHPGIHCQARLRAVQNREQFGRDDYVDRPRDVDAMSQRRTDEVCIEERDGSPDASDAEPDSKIIGAIAHQQSDNVAFADPASDCPARIAVCALSEFAIAQALACRKQRRCPALTFGDLIDNGRENARRLPSNRRRRLQCTQPCLRGSCPDSTSGTLSLHFRWAHNKALTVSVRFW